MIQTNLRMTDAALDPRRLAKQVREFGADAVLFNIGGIFAFYPTELELQDRNPLLRGDLLGEMIDATRSEGLRFLGRFDLSKSTKRAYEAHPEWFVHNREGRPLHYNGTYQACVNGGWYQDYVHRILREALTRYKVDGLFFNMFGYRSTDYSFNYFGICTCDNCQRRFRAKYGKSLPLREDFSDPAYRDYLEFQEWTTADLAEKIYDTVKSVDPDVGVMGHEHRCDLLRYEVQRAVDRPQPEWPYQSGEQARLAADIAKGRTYLSASANFIDFAWRFVAETPACHMLRFAQQLAGGASLDYYILGTLDQDDEKPLAEVSNLFRWHKANQGAYEGLISGAKVALYHSRGANRYRGAMRTKAAAQGAFRGAYRALLEARTPFDFVSGDDASTGELSESLARYEVVLLPNVGCIGDKEAELLDAYVEAGGTIIATGETGLYDEKGNLRERLALKSLPVESIDFIQPDMRGAYFNIAPGEVDLPGTKLMYIDGPYLNVTARDNADKILTLVPPQRFGPPELCYPELTSERPGALIGTWGKGKAVYIPWLPEWLYQRDSLPDHRTFLSGLIRRFSVPDVVLAGMGPVELTFHRRQDGSCLVHVVNYAGQRNNLYEEPPALHALRIGVRGAHGSAKALVAGTDLSPSVQDDREYTWFDLPPVRYFEAVMVMAA
jgi:hypothetical protein